MKEKKKTNIKIILIKTIRILVISYLTILVFLFFKQKDMIYYPDYPEASSFYDCSNFKTDEQKEYNWTRFYEKKWTNNNLVIFFHWNAWSACSRYEMKNILEQTWSSFIFVEYYWYSDLDTNNKPNIEKILQDTKNIWEYIKNSDYKQIYAVWRSVWTWPASYYTENFKTKTDKTTGVYKTSGLIKVGLKEDGTDQFDYVSFYDPYSVDLNDIVQKYENMIALNVERTKAIEDNYKFQNK